MRIIADHRANSIPLSQNTDREIVIEGDNLGLISHIDFALFTANLGTMTVREMSLVITTQYGSCSVIPSDGRGASGYGHPFTYFRLVFNPNVLNPSLPIGGLSGSQNLKIKLGGLGVEGEIPETLYHIHDYTIYSLEVEKPGIYPYCLPHIAEPKSTNTYPKDANRYVRLDYDLKVGRLLEVSGATSRVTPVTQTNTIVDCHFSTIQVGEEVKTFGCAHVFATSGPEQYWSLCHALFNYVNDDVYSNFTVKTYASTAVGKLYCNSYYGYGL